MQSGMVGRQSKPSPSQQTRLTMVKLEKGAQDLEALDRETPMHRQWYVDVPPKSSNWRQRALRRVAKTARSVQEKEERKLVAAFVNKTRRRELEVVSAFVSKAKARWEQPRLNFPKRTTESVSSAAASQSSDSVPIVEVPSSDGLDLGRPFKRVRLDSESQKSTPIPSQSTSQDTTSQPLASTRRNRHSPSRPLNPFKPCFSIPFAESSYPSDAEASLRQEGQHCSTHFGSQTWSPSLRVAASSEGYRCHWMTKQRSIFFPEGECCGRTFISADLLMRHLFRSHVELNSSLYACRWDTCANRTFYSMAAIENHMQKHLAPYGWSCPFQACRLSSSRPINRQTHDQHVEKVHDALYEQLRPLALPRLIKETLESSGPPPALPDNYQRSWQLSIPIPRSATRRAPRLAPWQVQQPASVSGGLVGIAPREDIRTTGAAPWSDILPLLDHLEPHAEPVNVPWPRKEGRIPWSVDLSGEDPALAQEKWNIQEAVHAKTEAAFDAVMDEVQRNNVQDGSGMQSLAADKQKGGIMPAAGTWTPPAPFPPTRRRAATTSLPPDGLRRDASTQTEGVVLYIPTDTDPRKRLASLSAVSDRLSLTPPPTYHEATYQGHGRNPALTPKRVERAVQMTHPC